MVERMREGRINVVFHALERLQVGGRETQMVETKVRKNESIEDALRRFKRSVAKSGTLAEIKKRRHYEKPSVKKKNKRAEASRKKRKF